MQTPQQVLQQASIKNWYKRAQAVVNVLVKQYIISASRLKRWLMVMVVWINSDNYPEPCCIGEILTVKMGLYKKPRYRFTGSGVDPIINDTWRLFIFQEYWTSLLVPLSVRIVKVIDLHRSCEHLPVYRPQRLLPTSHPCSTSHRWRISFSNSFRRLRMSPAWWHLKRLLSHLPVTTW